MLPKTDKCKHKLNKLNERGTIRLELRWFQNNLEIKDQTEFTKYSNNDCLECRTEARDKIRTEQLYNFYRDLKVSQVTILRPSTYLELQQQLSLLVPASCGIAAVERPDGKQAFPPYLKGEIIIFREIRPLRCDEDCEQRSGNEGCQWEEEVYHKLLQKL